MELENIILSEVTQLQKNMHSMHSLISGYKPKALNTQDTVHRPHEAQEEGDQCVGALVLLRRGTKYSQEQIMEIKV